MTDEAVADRLPATWPDPVRARVAAGAVVEQVAEGVTVLPRAGGDPAVALVVEGLLEVCSDEGAELAQLGPGAFIGEMSWLDGGEPRAAVRTLAPTTLAVFTGDARDVLEHEEVVVDHLRQLASRRSATNRAVSIDPLRGSAGPERTLGLRPMWPDDWRRLDANRDRVSARSLERRFFHRPNLSAGQLRRLTDVDYRDEFVWVATDPAIAAVGRYGRPMESPDVAEIALLVMDDWQGCGVGRLLLAALAVAAHVQGIPTFEAIVKSDNDAIRGLLDRHAPTWTSGEGPGVLVGRWSVTDMQDHEDVRVLSPRVAEIARQVVGVDE